MHFAIFPLHLSKVLHLPRKSDARSYEVLRLSHKIISANLKIWCSSMQPLSGNQRSDLLTALTNMSLALRPLPDPLHMSHACHRFWNCYTHALLTFDKVHNPLRLPRETTSERPKVLRTPSIFCTFDFDMLLRATTAYTFWTSQLPTGSEAAVFCTFGLGNVLRATTECTFSTSQLQKSSEADVLCTFWIGNVLCASGAPLDHL